MLQAPKTPIWTAAGPVAASILVVTGLAACGSSNHASIADCLNAKGFLVQGGDNVVRGSSGGGVSFTLTLYQSPAAARRALAAKSATSTALIGSAVADFTGNPPPYPGGPPGKLSRPALVTIRSCLTLR